MIFLSSTVDLLQVISTSTVALKVNASWIDLLGTAATPGRTNTAISTATTTNVVASPASSTTRNLKSMYINNTDASASETITVQHTDGTTVIPLWIGSLNAGDVLQYNEIDGFTVIDKTGARKIAAAGGRLLKTTFLSTGSTFTTSGQTNSMRVRQCGGGGGGAGCTSVASAASYGGGGGGGAYAEKLFSVTPNTAYTYAIGTAGAGNSGAAGGNGGNTTFTVGGTTVTAPGGTGAVVATATVTVGTGYAGGAGGTVPTNGDLNAPGQAGTGGVMAAVTPLGISGNGGGSFFGEGGVGLSAAGNGVAGTGFGSGGGGAATGASAVRTGGAGTVGAIYVDEYT